MTIKMLPLSRYVPLRLYQDAEQHATSRTEPQLWMDAAQPDSVFWCVAFQLHGLSHTVLETTAHESSPGGQLPALLLPNGDLLASGDIHQWFVKHEANASAAAQDADQQAWCALFERTLKPAYVREQSTCFFLNETRS